MAYGCRLFLLCLFACSYGAVAQTTTPFEVPKFVWWRGTSITLVKYRNDGNCLNIATNSSVTNGYNFDERNGWLGGIDQITFKMDGTSCVKVPTNKIGNPSNTWVQMYFQQGWKGCTTGFNQGTIAELRFFSDGECRQGQYQSVLNHMDMNMAQFPRDEECFSDRGNSGGYIYYRMFCDVVAPNHTTTLPVYVHTNITTLVPSIVKPADLIPLIQSLMVSNASLFKAFSVLSQSTTNNSSPPSPPPVAGAPNKSPSSGGPGFDVGLMVFTLIPAVFFFLLA